MDFSFWKAKQIIFSQILLCCARVNGAIFYFAVEKRFFSGCRPKGRIIPPTQLEIKLHKTDTSTQLSPILHNPEKKKKKILFVKEKQRTSQNRNFSEFHLFRPVTRKRRNPNTQRQ